MRLRFAARISKLGKRYVIYIPAEFKEQAEKLHGKQVIVTIEEISNQ